jgi:DNA-nicking Smr family endonuclease
VSGKTKKKSQPSKGGFEALRELRDTLKRQTPATPAVKQEKTPRLVNPRARKRADDDARLLHRAYTGVQPLDRSKGPRPRNPLEPASVTEAAAAKDARRSGGEDAAIHERLRVLALGQTPFEVSDEGDRVEGRRTDVPLDLLRRLRRGQFPVDARLDLHGMVAQEARTRVELFLRTMRSRRERMVLVIHGKGEHSPMGLGVLRGEISAWLSQGPSSENVAAFATARENDGGLGAVYVLLRR